MCLHVAANLHILDIRTMTLDFWNMVNFEVKLFRYYEGKIMNYCNCSAASLKMPILCKT